MPVVVELLFPVPIYRLAPGADVGLLSGLAEPLVMAAVACMRREFLFDHIFTSFLDLVDCDLNIYFSFINPFLASDKVG